MLCLLHRLKEDDEGQTLVLGAISMLVLALCVMTTLSIGQAAYEKIRLQNTADATSYSMAAVQARAFNFFAYTNRAMIAHYNTALTVVAYLSFALYLKNTIGRLLKVLQFIPPLTAIMAFINRVIEAAITVLRIFVSIVLPVIGALNLAYFAFQLGMWGVMQAQLVLNSRIATENDPDVITGVDLQNLNAGSLIQGAIKVLNLYMVNKAIDYKSMLAVVPLYGPNKNFDNVKTTNNPKIKNAAGQDRGNEGRLLMNELINAGRHPWVAGSTDGIKIFGRRWRSRVNILGFGYDMNKGARTEHGITTGMGVGSRSRHDMIFSIDQWYLQINVPSYWFKVTYNSIVIADYKKGGEAEQLRFEEDNCKRKKFGVTYTNPICAAARALAMPLTGGIRLAFAVVNATLGRLRKKQYLWFGITPFMKFNASPKWRQTFNQPQFFVMASKPDDKLTSLGNSVQNKYGMDTKTTSAVVNSRGDDSTLDLSIDVTQDGDFLAELAPGFNVFSVSRTYYHRPGEWKEHPNLFNPFWAAKLDPVAHHAFIGEIPHLSNFADEIILH